MNSYIFDFQQIDASKRALAGGKGSNLAELSRIDGIRVPNGFCISTEAYKRIILQAPSIKQLIDHLSLLDMKDRDTIRNLSSRIRTLIEAVIIPEDIRKQIMSFTVRFGNSDAYAVRSSATAEDLPTASFAGQQDTYLNIRGQASILTSISKCWASLFTERAVIYRMQNGFDHSQVYLSVIVQKMVFPQASGILFTADPVSSNRKLLSINASFGLGEAVVSGMVTPDCYKVQGHKIVDKMIASKSLVVCARNEGGTETRETTPEKQKAQAIPDEKILELAQTGRQIEKHFGCPQDIEWCLSDDRFFIVQSRPITTLFPVPETNDHENHVYVSVGHNQMMTDAMKPLGLSFFLLTTSALMRTAGGRLFVDVTKNLASTAGRIALLNTIGKSDPLIKDALMTIIERDFIPLDPDADSQAESTNKAVPQGTQPTIENDPSLPSQLIRARQNAIVELEQEIQSRSGPGLFDFIREHIQQSKKNFLHSQSLAVIMTAMEASFWLNEKIQEWLGEKGVADILSQSAPNNITSEMGLALLDVADVMRPYPEIIGYLKQSQHENFLDELERFEGGQKVRTVIQNFLDKYGMRCVGEIDITRTRWSERPSILLPVILNNIKIFEAGASKRKFEQGLQEALGKEQDLLNRLRSLPGGEQKARDAKQRIDLLRNFTGYREYPKYDIINRYYIYKKAMLKEAGEWVKAGILHEIEDIYYLNLEELREIAETKRVGYEIIIHRKEAFKMYEKLIPPRVITSEGEIISGQYKRENLPADAVVGLPVSSGITEGRARVILDMEDADLEDGDILVTAFTDPSWTPLFVSIKALVTEVGGLMTHGAVIAREYGLPAVVGVENATKIIKDRQRIRVNGTDGYIEIL